MATEKIGKKPSLSQKALKVRARAKNKKPKFVRAESWKYDRFSISWRRPRGLDNKIRRKIKGWPAGVSVGYKGPKIARGLHPSGYREVLVYNAQDVSAVDPTIQAARIAHTVGKRKRALIIAEAKKLNVKILNFKVSKEPEAKEEEQAEGEATEGQPKTKEAVEEKKVKQKKTKKKETAPKKTKPKAKKGEEKQ